MTITYDFDLEDTAQSQRPVGEETRLLGIQDSPSVPPRRPRAIGKVAEQTAFGLVPGSTGEHPIVLRPYIGRHREPELPPLITPAAAPAESVPPPVAPRRGLFARLFGRVGG